MTGLKTEARQVKYYLALALAKKGKLIWSTQAVTDWGHIVDKLPSPKIPPYRWMGHLWYYPQFKKTFNQLNDSEKQVIRQRASQIKTELRQQVFNLLQ